MQPLFRTILVVGPESSGSKVVTELLLTAGAAREAASSERAGYSQDWNRFAPFDPPYDSRPLVLHRSLPYSFSFSEAFFDFPNLRVVVMMRSLFILEQSQLNANHVKTRDQARRNIARAYEIIFRQIKLRQLPFHLTSLESLTHEDARRRLRSFCNLEDGDDFEIRDEDSKHYHDSERV